MDNCTVVNKGASVRRAFRTPAGVMVTALTLEGGARLYKPVVAAWMRVLHDRRAAA